jgi:pimeloyl-ACP methyl ester carboxylesterase
MDAVAQSIIIRIDRYTIMPSRKVLGNKVWMVAMVVGGMIYRMFLLGWWITPPSFVTSWMFSSPTLFDSTTTRTRMMMMTKESTTIQRQYDWMFREQYPIAYDRTNILVPPVLETTSYRTINEHEHVHDQNDSNVLVLLLNGFGMGTFHQQRLIEEWVTTLHEADDDDATTTKTNNKTNMKKNMTIYAMDYLGQSQSWPLDCADGTSDAEYGLQYSGATWVDQIVQFMEQVILTTTNIHLVGNSVGGYLATYVAAIRPDLIATVCLLNATPIWGLNLPGWSGHLPAPMLPKLVGRWLFDQMRTRTTIQQFLQTTYVNPTAYNNEQFIQQIQSCTDGPGGHAAFASILWSPPLRMTVNGIPNANLYDCLENLPCDVLLCFGRDDPWCKPAFAKRMLDRLAQRTNPNLQHRYVELSNVGHCPHHEAPKATARILMNWLMTTSHTSDRNCVGPFLLAEKETIIQEAWGETIVHERSADEIALSWMDQLAITIL